jgi:flavin reductase (DIM6/NTAB) family NADH-FMN oxidoreductase RutF
MRAIVRRLRALRHAGQPAATAVSHRPLLATPGCDTVSQLIRGRSGRVLIYKEFFLGTCRAMGLLPRHPTPDHQETDMPRSAPCPTAAAPEQLAADFRDAMRRVASSVTLITTRDAKGAPHGMAASAVIPVSMDPPSILVAVNRNSGLHPTLSAEGRFCVNLLASEHQPLLGAFSQSARRAERFTSDDWGDGSDALPNLATSPAAVSCEVDQRVDYGSHTLFIGRVTGVRLTCEHNAPLVWFEGAGTSIAPRAAAAA